MYCTILVLLPEICHLLENVHSLHMWIHSNCIRNNQPELGFRIVIITWKVCTFQHVWNRSKPNTYTYHLWQTQGYHLNGNIYRYVMHNANSKVHKLVERNLFNIDLRNRHIEIWLMKASLIFRNIYFLIIIEIDVHIWVNIKYTPNSVS